MFFYSHFTVHGIFVMFVCKFGGTALSDAQNVKKVIKIIKSDKARRFVVVSAMGKAFVKDRKVTDVLCDCFFELNETGSMKSWDFVANKYLSLAEKLDAPVDMRALLKNVREQILASPYRDFVVSRGEYLSAKLLSAALGFRYIEAAEVVRFFPDGALNLAESERLLADSAKNCAKGCVMGGFYGSDGMRTVTFPRGGSDISGAVAAAALNAEIYENWTDVDGFFAADPSMVFSPRLVPCLSYEQLRILSSLGARVLHSDSVLPVCAKNIPINIRNFYKPHLDGSMIVPVSASGRRIFGIVSETVYKYSFSGSFYLPPKASVLFQSVSPKGRICVTKQRLPAGSASCGFKAEQKCLVGAVFHQCADMAEKASRALSQKNIGYEILSCDRTLLLLLTDSSDRVEAVRALNDLV